MIAKTTNLDRLLLFLMVCWMVCFWYKYGRYIFVCFQNRIPGDCLIFSWAPQVTKERSFFQAPATNFSLSFCGTSLQTYLFCVLRDVPHESIYFSKLSNLRKYTWIYWDESEGHFPVGSEWDRLLIVHHGTKNALHGGWLGQLCARTKLTLRQGQWCLLGGLLGWFGCILLSSTQITNLVQF